MAGDADGSLTFVLDHNLGRNVLAVLRMAKASPEGRITLLDELGIPGDTLDEAWLTALGSRANQVVVTRDGEILNAAVRRIAWRASGISLLMLDKRWGTLTLRDVARTSLFWWPHMVQQANVGPLGAAWTVSHRLPAAPTKGIRLVTAPDP